MFKQTGMTGQLNPVWVTASKVFKTETKWEFLVSNDEPGSPGYVQPIPSRSPMEPNFYTYEALAERLRSRGYTAPSLAYFITQCEGEPPADKIIRRIPAVAPEARPEPTLFRRFPICCPVTYHTSQSEGHGTIWNISVSGWRLSGDVPLRVGQTCPLTVHVPNQLGLFVAGAIVRWARDQEYGLETLVVDSLTQSRVVHIVTQQVALERIE